MDITIARLAAGLGLYGPEASGFYAWASMAAHEKVSEGIAHEMRTAWLAGKKAETNAAADNTPVQVEYHTDGSETIHTSYDQPGHEHCGDTRACPTGEHTSPWDYV